MGKNTLITNVFLVGIFCLLMLSMVSLVAGQNVYVDDIMSENSMSTEDYRVAVPDFGEEACDCEIEFMFVPPMGSNLDLEGLVVCCGPNDCNDFNLAVYINVPPYGWWIKPRSGEPLTPVASDCSWSCDITTGGRDPWAVEIIAFLWPKDEGEPPIVLGEQCLPDELFLYCHTPVIRYRKISFSGYEWWIKRSCHFSVNDRVGPGPNYFSDSEENVWVDPDGYLHLKIVKRDGKFYCSEIIGTDPFGDGIYVFVVGSRVDLLDERVVLGGFLWEDCVPPHYRELDIEFTKWSDPGEPNNSQYVVMPDWPGHKHRFNTDYAFDSNCIVDGNESTHIIIRHKDKICFLSYYGDFCLVPPERCFIDSWCFTNSEHIPDSGASTPRINLWLDYGNLPSDGQEAEIVVRSFQYIPDVNGLIDFFDYAVFAKNWKKQNCGRCGGADLNQDSEVNILDMGEFCENWLQRPW